MAPRVATLVGLCLAGLSSAVGQAGEQPVVGAEADGRPAEAAASAVAIPPFFEKIATARWMSHNLDWGTISSISARNDTGVGAPFGNPASFVDSGDGRVYFYVSALDASIVDLTSDSRMAFTLSEAQIPGRCNTSSLNPLHPDDPEDPRCGRLVLSGRFSRVPANESDAAKAALVSRHPEMANWPASHDFFVGTLWPLSAVFLIDMFGGATIIPPADYLAASPPSFDADSDLPAARPVVAAPASSTPSAPPRPFEGDEAAPTSSASSATPNASAPPPADDKIATARWMSHQLDWAVMSTISARNESIIGAPFGNPSSVVDTGNGRVYMYVSTLDASIVDVAADSRVALTFTEAQMPGHCDPKTLDPEDPVCARLVLSGRLARVPANESDAAKAALFARHPAMKSWPAGHDFYVATLWPLTSVWLIDYFGGATLIDPAKYLAAAPPTLLPVSLSDLSARRAAATAGRAPVSSALVPAVED